MGESWASGHNLGVSMFFRHPRDPLGLSMKDGGIGNRGLGFVIRADYRRFVHPSFRVSRKCCLLNLRAFDLVFRWELIDGVTCGLATELL